MKWEKDLIIVTFSSIIFGLASFLFLRIPYMVWGTFDGAFAFSFVLWSCYIGMLYISIKLQSSGDKKYIQWGIKAIVLGILAAIVKMAFDTMTEKLLVFVPDMLTAAAIIEIVIILYGIMIISFLFIFVAKRHMIRSLTEIKKTGIVLACCLGIYALMMLYYRYQLYHWIERFSKLEVMQEVGIEQGTLNLALKYAQSSTLPGAIIYTSFFIIFWNFMKKITV